MEEKFPGIIIREELSQELNIKEDRIQVMQFTCLVYKGFVFVRPSYTMSPRPQTISFPNISSPSMLDSFPNAIHYKNVNSTNGFVEM